MNREAYEHAARGGGDAPRLARSASRAAAPPTQPGSDRGARRRAHRLFAVLVAAVLLAALGAAALTLARHRREGAQRDRLARAAEAGPRVLVATAARPAGERSVTLPGDVAALLQTTLYGKVNGYVAEMRVDKGDRVRRGEVLAVISSPETDQQVRAARAALEVRRRNALRARRLAPNGIVSLQDLDQANADLRSAQADFERARALQGYEIVRAPFDGVVTARYVDPGALLTATATGQPVVDLADPARVRVFVNAGQDVAPFVKVGDPAVATLDQRPDLRIPLRVRRTADALDPRSRTMLVELWPDADPGVRLVPGLFVHVDLRVAAPALPSVPAEALVARGERLQVAVVRDGKLHFVDVVPGATDGRSIEIRRGLDGGETVALSPPSDLAEGAPVQPLARDGGGEPRAGRTPLR